MARAKLQYVCRECGAVSSKWAGQCGDCGAWNSLEELQASVAAQGPRGGGYAGEAARITRLKDVPVADIPLSLIHI